MSIAARPKTARASIMLPETANARIQALADANRVSEAWVVRTAVLQYSAQAELPLRLRLPNTKRGTEA